MNITYTTSKEDEIKVARNTIENLYVKLQDQDNFLPLSLGMKVSNLDDTNLIEQKSDFIFALKEKVEPKDFKAALYSWTQEAFNDCILDTPFLDKIDATGKDDVYGVIKVESPLIDNDVELLFNKIEDVI